VEIDELAAGRHAVVEEIDVDSARPLILRQGALEHIADAVDAKGETGKVPAAQFRRIVRQFFAEDRQEGEETILIAGFLDQFNRGADGYFAAVPGFSQGGEPGRVGAQIKTQGALVAL